MPTPFLTGLDRVLDSADVKWTGVPGWETRTGGNAAAAPWPPRCGYSRTTRLRPQPASTITATTNASIRYPRMPPIMPQARATATN